MSRFRRIALLILKGLIYDRSRIKIEGDNVNEIQGDIVTLLIWSAGCVTASPCIYIRYNSSRKNILCEYCTKY